jgi:ketosteroid isomerase-like protein
MRARHLLSSGGALAILRAMSRENVERAYEAYDAFNRRDFDAGLALHRADVEITPLVAAVGSPSRGSAGVRRYWEDLLSLFPDFTSEALELYDLGELTLCKVRFRGHGAGSEAPIDQTIWQLARWIGGQIAWWRSYASEAEAREAAGQGEPA